MFAGILVLAGYTAAVCWVFGISRAPDFAWHLRSLDRLLWPPAVAVPVPLQTFKSLNLF